MKKNVIAGVMLAIAAIFGTSSAFAQNQAGCQNQGSCQKKCTGTENCAKARQGKQAFNPFEGLNLTTEQQTKIDALRSECKTMKANAKKAEDAKKDQFKKEAREGRNQMKAEMLKKVKAILTPEQYVQFLENSFVNNGGPRMKGHDKMAMNHGQKGHKGNKDFKKGHKENKQNKSEKKDK